MSRLLLSFLCLLALLPEVALARLEGPLPGWQKPEAIRDLAEIRRTGELRVLINQSRNSSGSVKGQAIGIEYVRLKAFEQYLNRNASVERIRLKLIPKPKDQLLGALQRGEGDLVAPGELLEADGQPYVSRSSPTSVSVPLVLVTREGGRVYRRLDQLSGRSLALPPGSAAGPVIERLNRELIAKKRAPIVVEWVDSSLAVEDVLEMVQAGIYPATITERTIAERWLKVMPKLHITRNLDVAEPGDTHWYFHRESRTLLARADRFLQDYRPPANQDAAFERAYRRLYKVHDPLDRVGRKRLEKMRPILQRHAEQLKFDWLGLAALAFKESTLDPAARGASGAVGLMQILPATARSVGVSNIQSPDGNVQASARYLAMLREQYFASPRLNERERLAFVLAAYNLGPQRVQSLRAEARRLGLNPDQWFFQVERIAMESIGMGVVNYVNSINKYYLAFARERYLLEAGKVNARR